MNLTYRGVSYQPQSRADATKKSNITVKFRGLTYQLSQSIEPVNYSPYPLKYRGISDQKSPQVSPAHAPEQRLSTSSCPGLISNESNGLTQNYELEASRLDTRASASP